LVWFPAELNTFGVEVLCSLVMVNAGGVLVLLPAFVALPVGLNRTGGTLVIMPVFPASGDDVEEEGGHWPLGIQYGLLMPGSHGMHLSLLPVEQPPVGEYTPAAFAIELLLLLPVTVVLLPVGNTLLMFPRDPNTPGGILIVAPPDLLPVEGAAFVMFPSSELLPAAIVALDFGKGFRVQFGGIGIFSLHPGGLSEDILLIGLPVLVVGFVEFGAKLNRFGEAGLCSLVMVEADSVRLLLLLPEEGRTVPKRLGWPVCPLDVSPVLLPKEGSTVPRFPGLGDTPDGLPALFLTSTNSLHCQLPLASLTHIEQ
jgi:hypothetical protein